MRVIRLAGRPRPSIDWVAVQAGLERGDTVRTIADNLHMSYETLRCRIHQEHPEWAALIRRNPPLPPIDWAAIQAALERGDTVQTLADNLHINYETLRCKIHQEHPEWAALIRRNLANAMRGRWEALPPEEQEQWRQNQQALLRHYWQTVPPEQREAHLQSLHNGWLHYWQSLTPEQRENRLQSLHDGWAALSPEQRTERFRRLQDGNREWWETLSPEQRSERLRSIQEGRDRREWWGTLSPEQQNERIRLLRDSRWAGVNFWEWLQSFPQEKQFEILRAMHAHSPHPQTS